MFPTIGDLIYYLLNIRVSFPIQTFGFFVVLAFLSSYFVFKSEFKRYESIGKIHAFARRVYDARPASIFDIAVNFILGFLFGWKVLGVALNYSVFALEPRGYILSLQGSIICGCLAGAAFALWVYLDRKEYKNSPAGITEQIVHPYQLMGLIVFSVGFFGFIGAKLFDSVEHVSQFEHDPWGTLFSKNGFTYYGGLIFGALTYLFIGYRHGMKQVHLADIGSPGMMLAYGVGRIGCQLSGDGDWGIINRHLKPEWLSWLPDWMWSFRFPHNSINAGVTIPMYDCNYCNELVKGVYPTSFYEAVLCIGMFLLMWAFRHKIKTPGLMFSIYLVLNGGERFLIEHIRVNINYTIFGISFTQAEIIGGLMLLGGITGLVIIAIKKLDNKTLVPG